MKQRKSGGRTLLWSVLMSSPGPLILGIGLIFGRSSTQIADFVRRSSELLAIIMSFAVFRLTTKDGYTDTVKKEKLERLTNIFVGAMMCLGGGIMLVLAFASEEGEKGNVIPGLCVAVLGVIANAVFWRRYTALNKKEPNSILAVQARLYRAKSLVDACVTLALGSVAVFPGSEFSSWLDLIGSAVVAVYLIWCGIKTVWEKTGKK